MKVIAQQSEWLGRETGPGTAAMAGWELADEIDMLGSPESGYDTLNEILGTLPDDGRLRFNNYAKGITFWLEDAQAARYVNEFQDVLSADNYWFTDENICCGDGGRRPGGGRRRPERRTMPPGGELRRHGQAGAPSGLPRAFEAGLGVRRAGPPVHGGGLADHHPHRRCARPSGRA